jgi:hypothetical protein
MKKDERDLLDVLKFELEFLKKGGYGSSPRQPWRFQHIFEDSPTCMNYDSKENPGPCSDCVLMQLVPQEFLGTRIPCRHIPLNAGSETLDSLYRYADGREIEETFGKWLRTTIAKIEEMRSVLLGNGRKYSPPGTGEAMGEPLFQNLHPKCANPACATAFHWTTGGRFFRFSADSANSTSDHKEGHGVKHYWLCERCLHVYTLMYDESKGVALKLLWRELLAEEPAKQLLAGLKHEWDS